MYADYKFGKRTCDLPMSNEDWQFEKPLLSVSKDQKPKYERTHPKVVKAKPIPIDGIPASEFFANLEKEDKQMKFTELPMDKQLKMIAEEYNKGTPVRDMSEKFALSMGSLYKRINDAKAAGLIAEMRVGDIKQDTTKNEAVYDGEKLVITSTATLKQDTSASADIEAFNTYVQGLQESFARAQQAKQIALAIHELLGDEAGDVLGLLFDKVSA